MLAPSLLTLPRELIDKIITHILGPDLISLAFAHPYFYQQYQAQILVELTSKSLVRGRPIRERVDTTKYATHFTSTSANIGENNIESITTHNTHASGLGEMFGVFNGLGPGKLGLPVVIGTRYRIESALIACVHVPQGLERSS